MATYHNKVVLELRNQLVLAPKGVRFKQLRKLERFIDSIETNKVYPYEFICHAITGYRPAESKGVLLRGRHFVRDMVQMGIDLSASLDLAPCDIEEDYFSTRQVTEEFNVSARTLTRWRSFGLRCRKIAIDSWRKKTVYLASALDVFRKKHARLISKSGAFSLLSDVEKREIIALARRVNVSGKLSISKVAEIVARGVGRSRETVRYTLRRHDLVNPAGVIFDDGYVVPKREREKLIVDLYNRGLSVSEIAADVKRHRATIYRIIYRKKAEEILSRKYEYIYENVFDSPEAEKIIFGHMQGPKESRARMILGKAEAKEPADTEELLTKEEEYGLFRKYNFFKHRICSLRKKLEQNETKASLIRKIERFHRRAMGIKKRLVMSNIGLAMKMARSHMGYGLDFQELLSEGNISLMKAIEKFDYKRGVRFSTYASWAIIKNYARMIPEENLQRGRFLTGREEIIEMTGREGEPFEENREILSEFKKKIGEILGALSKRERYIIVHRFGLEEEAGPQTLEEIGQLFNLSRERVRQIEKKALDKLKDLMDGEMVEEMPA